MISYQTTKIKKAAYYPSWKNRYHKKQQQRNIVFFSVRHLANNIPSVI